MGNHIEWQDIPPVDLKEKRRIDIRGLEGSDKIGRFFIEGNEDYSRLRLTFINIVFTDRMSWQDVNLQDGLVFHNCTFKSTLNFTDCYTSADVTKGSYIRFVDCHFEGSFECYGVGEEKKMANKVHFVRCEILSGMAIDNIRCEELKLVDCVSKYEIRLDGIFCNLIDISRTVLFAAYIETRESSLRLFESTINERFTFNQHANHNLSIVSSKFPKGFDLYLNESTQPFNVIIFGSQFDEDFQLYFTFNFVKPTNANFKISNTNFIGGFFVENDKILKPNSSISTFEVIFTNTTKGEISVNDIYIDDIKISGYNSESNVTFSGISTRNFLLDNFNNGSGFRLIDIMPQFIDANPSMFAIRNTQLGNAFLSNIDFRLFSEVQISNVNMSSINTSMVEWFIPDLLNSSEYNFMIDGFKNNGIGIGVLPVGKYELQRYFKSQAEIFRQLKVATKKEGNIPQSLEFQRHEMNCYRQQIKPYSDNDLTKFKRREVDQIYRRKTNGFGENFILRMNQTNDFGQNWIKPIWFLFFSAAILSIPISFFTSATLNYSTLATCKEDIRASLFAAFSSDTISRLFIILNPTHRVSDLVDHSNKIPVGLYVVDLLSRVVVSYFLFQIVSAFRKFNK